MSLRASAKVTGRELVIDEKKVGPINEVTIVRRDGSQATINTRVSFSTTDAVGKPRTPLKIMQVPEAGGEAEAFYEAMGPWVEGSSLEEHFSISRQRLAQWRTEHKVLGVRFGNGRFYYPVQQFVDGKPQGTFRQVLAVLSKQFEPATIASFMASVVEPNGEKTYWDLLHDDAVDMVEWAERTANHYAA